MDGLTGWPAQLSAWIIALQAHEFWMLLGLCTLATLGGSLGGFLSLHRGRLIENTPTSRIRSAAQGFVELSGRAWPMPGEPVLAPLTFAPCCWWRFKVERRETVTVNGKRKNVWRTLEREVSEALFLLRDPTGDCLIDPDHADVHPDQQQTWYGASPRPLHPPRASRLLWSSGHYRYTQATISVGARLYALGTFRTLDDFHNGAVLREDVRQLTAERLREWKQDQAALIERFDANRDGVVDSGEWAAARAAAETEIRAEIEAELAADGPGDGPNRDAALAGHHLLSRPRDGRPFILSTLSERTLVRRYRIGTALGISLALTGFSLLLLALKARGWLA